MSRTKSRILVPITSAGPDRAEELALALCEGYGADLYLIPPHTVPDQTPLTIPEERIQQQQEVSGEVLSILLEGGPDVDVSGGVRAGHNLESLVINAASEHNVDLIVLDTDMFSAESRLRRSKIRRIARNATCDVVVIRGPGMVDDLRTLLVPIADGPHSGLAIETAAALLVARDVWVDVLHIVSPSASEEDIEQAETMLQDALDRFDSDRADDWLLEAEDVAETIIEESKQYSLTMMGTPERNRLKRFFFGSTTDSVVADSTVPVIVTWRNQS